MGTSQSFSYVCKYLRVNMKIVIALALVACVYIQAAPVRDDGAGFHCEAAEECKGTKCTVKFIGPHAKECKEHFKGKNLQKIPHMHKEMKCVAHKEHGKVIFIGKNKKECEEAYHKLHGKDGDEDGAGFHCEAAEECKGTKCTVKFIGDHAKECKEHFKGKNLQKIPHMHKEMKCMAHKEHGKVI